MINAFLTIFFMWQGVQTDYLQQNTEVFLASSITDQNLSFKNSDQQLLNATVFHMINQQRRHKSIDTLQFSSALFLVAKNIQEQLEFKSFVDVKSVEAKANLKLDEKCKNSGFQGTLTQGIAGQSNAINYEEKRDFFYDKTDKNSEFRLYYGSIKQKKLGKEISIIPSYTYREFAQNLIKNLPGESLKQLQSKAYQYIGIHLQWHYKSLEKNQIPQIKLLCVLGGYQTAGIRKKGE